MSAHLYSMADWHRARDRRATVGKAPRLAVRRAIVMRQMGNGLWRVALAEWRFGIWQKPKWLSDAKPLPEARTFIEDAWAEYRLPVVWNYVGERGLRPLRFGVSEPEGSAA